MRDTENHADDPLADGGSGGGIFNAWGGALMLTNSTVSGNSASQRGGGISNDGTATVTNSTASGNSVDADVTPLTEDQRGAMHPSGSMCDVGAFELEVAP